MAYCNARIIFCAYGNKLRRGLEEEKWGKNCKKYGFMVHAVPLPLFRSLSNFVAFFSFRYLEKLNVK